MENPPLESSENRPRLFFGWWIVLAGSILAGVGAVGHTCVAERLSEIIQELGDSPASMAAILGVSHGASAIAMLVTGPLIDRWGPGKPMLVGIALAGLGMIGLSIPRAPVVLHSLYFVGISCGIALPLQTTVASWFSGRRVLALTLLSVATLSGMHLGKSSPAGGDESLFGYGDLVWIGLALLALGIPLALLVRHRPEQIGQLPDGAVSPPPEEDFTWREAVRTRAFWLLVAGMGLVGSFSHLSVASLLQRGSFPEMSQVQFLSGLAGLLALGYLGDRFSKRHLLALGALLQGLGLLVLVGDQLHLYALLFGLGMQTAPLQLAIRADYFGRRAFATLTVLSGTAMSVPVVLVPLLTTVLPAAGRLPAISLLSIAVSLAAAALFVCARPPGKPAKESREH